MILPASLLSLPLSLSLLVPSYFFVAPSIDSHGAPRPVDESDTRQAGTSSSLPAGRKRKTDALSQVSPGAGVSRARTSRRFGEQRNSARAKRDRRGGNNAARPAPFAPASRDTAENYNNWLDYRWDMVIGSARLPASPG